MDHYVEMRSALGDVFETAASALEHVGPLTLVYREGWSPMPAPAADVEPAGPVDKRAETIAGLRELADWLAANPDVPVFGSESFQVFPQNFPHITTEGEAVAELLRIAALVGVEPTQSTHASISVGFRGGISYGAVVCDVQLADHAPQDVTPAAGEVAGPVPPAGPATAADDEAGPVERCECEDCDDLRDELRDEPEG
jgi:hypothetical protein